jgi:hypothetical protein
MSDVQYELGYQAMAETIGNGGDIFAKLNDFSSNEGPASATFKGAVSCVLTAYVVLRERGVDTGTCEHVATGHFLKSDGPTMCIELNRWFASGNTESIRKCLATMAYVVNHYRAMIRFKSQGASPTPAQPLDVRVVNMPAPATEPAQVQVVAMPARITNTRVERDQTGEIVSTTQLQQDVAA